MEGWYMRRVFFILLTLVFILSFFFLDPFRNEKHLQRSRKLKQPAPVTGTVDVSGSESLQYCVSGNPGGEPVLVLQTDPGLALPPAVSGLFDRDKFRIITFLQRGTGMGSTERALAGNNTPACIDDIERLLDHLNINKVYVAGGFWGAGLALLFAQDNPGRVRGMVLWSCFTCTPQEIQNIYGGRAASFFPGAYAELKNAFPSDSSASLEQAMLTGLTQKNLQQRDIYAGLWAAYWNKLTHVPGGFDPLAGLDRAAVYRFALVENYYMKNRFFLQPGVIMDRMSRIADIPAAIISGRYDVVSPPATAAAVHAAMPGSKLIILDGKSFWPVSGPFKEAVNQGMGFVCGNEEAEGW